MKKSVQGQHVPVKMLQQVEDENLYLPSNRQKATPYYVSYMSAYGKKPVYEDPIEIIQEVQKPFKAKRGFFVLLITILAIVVLATCAMSAFNILPQYTAIFTAPDAVDAKKFDTITVDDILKSSLLKFFSVGKDNGKLRFYNDCLKNIDNVENKATVVAYYALPVALALAVLLGIYVLIKALKALFSNNRFKFGFIVLLQFLFIVLVSCVGIIWNDAGVNAIFDILKGDSAIAYGLGLYILFGATLLSLICTMFAYKKDKEAKIAKKTAKAYKKAYKKAVKSVA